MIRYMSSVARPARQIIHQKPFSTTSKVQFVNFEKRVEALHKAQFDTQTDPRPTYLKNNTMYFSITCMIGVVTGALTIEAIYDFFKTY